MKKTLLLFLQILNIIAFVFTILFVVTGLVFELFGAAVYEQMFNSLGLPWSFDTLFYVTYGSVLIWIITLFLLQKFFDHKQD